MATPTELTREVALWLRTSAAPHHIQVALAELHAQAEAGQRAKEALTKAWRGELSRTEYLRVLGKPDPLDALAVPSPADPIRVQPDSELANEIGYPAPSPADQDCDGSRDCRAAVHLHGCYAERPSA